MRGTTDELIASAGSPVAHAVRRAAARGGGAARACSCVSSLAFLRTGLQSLIRSMVNVDRDQRKSLFAFVSHPWLNEDGPALDRLVQAGLDPESIQELQGHTSLLLSEPTITVDEPLVAAMSEKFKIPVAGEREAESAVHIQSHMHVGGANKDAVTHVIALRTPAHWGDIPPPPFSGGRNRGGPALQPLQRHHDDVQTDAEGTKPLRPCRPRRRQRRLVDQAVVIPCP